ncbi:unnamed protein product [Mytilus coruscus]|uniref:Uncharacterized protein n=1 Tax=Mytilus coruscus TaxID=42192 RepID=A0A6J8B1D2_MYTCO|nr:unnamed protein product [Mytilus coruscus]
MDFWLQRFIMEAKKKKGGDYPPKSLYYIVCGLLGHLRDMNVNDKNFLDEKDGRFAPFRRVLDAKMKDLLSKGFGTKTRKADLISHEDEELLWVNGVFGKSSATTLKYTVFFYNCKLFGLRGRDEHRNFDCDQFEIGIDSTGKFIRFIGRNNKTFKGGLGHMQLANKDIKHYSQGALGVNKLHGLMRELCQKGGLLGNYTNHSGKRTCATALYHAGIDEQEIMTRTGHRSTASVRAYKTSNGSIQKNVSKS